MWQQEELFHARPAGTAREPEMCVAADLFEVIAELAGLDLEQRQQSAEAVALAGDAQQRLAS